MNIFNDRGFVLDLGTYTIINNVGKSRTYMTQFPILEPDILGSEEFNKLSVNERFEKSLVTIMECILVTRARQPNENGLLETRTRKVTTEELRELVLQLLEKV